MELLTVIFIISLLLVMMSPFLHSAKESARNTLCQNNLEKLSAALRVPVPGESYVSLPDSPSWLARAVAGGGEPSLKCPKGYFEGGVGGFVARPNVQITEPPMSAVFDAPIPDIENNETIWGWAERINYVLPRDVKVDITQPGTYAKNHGSTSKTIPAGTAVNCYFLHFDAVDKGPANTQGEAVFGSDILGVICLSKSHDAVDDILGAPGTTYHTGRSSRGFEDSGQDCVTLQADMRTLTIDRFYVTSPGEDVRILTAPRGEASYAMNNQVKPHTPAPGQLLLVEYNKPVADVDGDGTDDDLGAELAPRHFGRVNTLLVDGGVRLRWPDRLDANQPIWRP